MACPSRSAAVATTCSGSALADGGIVIDHRARRAVTVDPPTSTVVVEPGALLGDVDAATAPHDLALPIGINTTTGLAGLALGGGIGWLHRRHGLTADHLIGADVVLADGTLVHASDDDDRDLMWALRGGGGNFGIVTRFVFRAVAQRPELIAGLTAFPSMTASRSCGATATGPPRCPGRSPRSRP